MPTCKIILPEQENIVEMKDMKPLQWGVIVSMKKYIGHIVMRTADSCNVEIINLTTFKENSCWAGASSIKVKIGKGPLNLTIEN